MAAISAISSPSLAQRDATSCSPVESAFQAEAVMNPKCLLHVEDDTLWRSGMHHALGPSYRLRSVATIREARIELGRERPDLVLLDVRLPDGSGLDLAASLQTLAPRPAILLFTSCRDEAALWWLQQLRCAGMLWKDEEALSRLPWAIDAVLGGAAYFPTEVRQRWREIRSAPRAFFKLLSERELELLPAFGVGEDDDAIAAKFGLSEATVRTHRRNILAKLDLRTRAQLIHWAIRTGIVRV